MNRDHEKEDGGMTVRMRTTRGYFCLVMALVGVAVLAACGGGNGDAEARAGTEDFNARLASIVQTENVRYGELAERVGDLSPDQPLPADVKQQMRDLAQAARRAADALEQLTAPPEATPLVRELGAALRQRADDFERASSRSGVTLQQLETEGDITESGERLDRAVRALIEAGFLPEAESHE